MLSSISEPLCHRYLSAADHRPRGAEHAVLYRVTDEHLEAFFETAKRQADGALGAS